MPSPWCIWPSGCTSSPSTQKMFYFCCLGARYGPLQVRTQNLVEEKKNGSSLLYHLFCTHIIQQNTQQQWLSGHLCVGAMTRVFPHEAFIQVFSAVLPVPTPVPPGGEPPRLRDEYRVVATAE